ncbi:unnamed protein product [Aureobasidium vineae]|uniref:Uncharacterized protein n=1 Tax=Aureobasidium vineae TaxID=2773715 RepID=A0A9N8JZK6_9PEZI|nr:unnamed protein product [Aureobasidium vineae]
MHTLLMLALRPELLREPQFRSSLAGVFLSARSAAWQLVRRLTSRSSTSKIKPMTPGSFVRRPQGVATVQPAQNAGTRDLTLRFETPKT